MSENTKILAGAYVGPNLRQRLLAGLLAGLVAGLFCSLAVNQPSDLVTTLIVGLLLGAGFGLWLGPTIQTAGASLVWGQALGLFWWLFGSLTLLPLLRGGEMFWQVDGVKVIFAELLMNWGGLGALLGLLYFGFVEWLPWGDPPTGAEPVGVALTRVPSGQAVVPPLVQSLIIGGFSGLVGSWVFAWGVDRASFYPLVAQLVRADSLRVGQTLHYLIGVVIGVTFGLLFQRNAQRPGIGLMWGINYGLLWWLIGPLTLMPWLLGFWQSADWSLAAAQNLGPSLVAHLLYGALVGYLSGLANQLWEVLFVASDPLNRSREGGGVYGARGLLMGTAAGVVGGLVFTVVMLGTGALPAIAQLVGARSVFAGLIVHLVISVIVGVSYGLLFQRQMDGYGAGLAWGMLYGFFWWVLGTLTLYPLLLRQAPDWSLATMIGFYPSLIGHLLYGAGLGLFFQYLSQRYTRTTSRGRALHQPAEDGPAITDTGAAALWIVTLTLGIILPLLLSANLPTTGLY
jgi:uncharacterized membrane protein YagU involved in acid resistance